MQPAARIVWAAAFALDVPPPRTITSTTITSATTPEPATLATFENQQLLTREGLIGRATSASYVPREGRRFEILSESLAALFDRYRDAGGHVTMKYVTKVYLAERR